MAAVQARFAAVSSPLYTLPQHAIDARGRAPLFRDAPLRNLCCTITTDAHVHTAAGSSARATRYDDGG